MLQQIWIISILLFMIDKCNVILNCAILNSEFFRDPAYFLTGHQVYLDGNI